MDFESFVVKTLSRIDNESNSNKHAEQTFEILQDLFPLKLECFCGFLTEMLTASPQYINKAISNALSLIEMHKTLSFIIPITKFSNFVNFSNAKESWELKNRLFLGGQDLLPKSDCKILNEDYLIELFTTNQVSGLEESQKHKIFQEEILASNLSSNESIDIVVSVKFNAPYSGWNTLFFILDDYSKRPVTSFEVNKNLEKKQMNEIFSVINLILNILQLFQGSPSQIFDYWRSTNVNQFPSEMIKHGKFSMISFLWILFTRFSSWLSQLRQKLSDGPFAAICSNFSLRVVSSIWKIFSIAVSEQELKTSVKEVGDVMKKFIELGKNAQKASLIVDEELTTLVIREEGFHGKHAWTISVLDTLIQISKFKSEYLPIVYDITVPFVVQDIFGVYSTWRYTKTEEMWEIVCKCLLLFNILLEDFNYEPERIAMVKEEIKNYISQLENETRASKLEEIMSKEMKTRKRHGLFKMLKEIENYVFKSTRFEEGFQEMAKNIKSIAHQKEARMKMEIEEEKHGQKAMSDVQTILKKREHQIKQAKETLNKLECQEKLFHLTNIFLNQPSISKILFFIIEVVERSNQEKSQQNAERRFSAETDKLMKNEILMTMGLLKLLLSFIIQAKQQQVYQISFLEKALFHQLIGEKQVSLITTVFTMLISTEDTDLALECCSVITLISKMIGEPENNQNNGSKSLNAEKQQNPSLLSYLGEQATEIVKKCLSKLDSKDVSPKLKIKLMELIETCFELQNDLMILFLFLSPSDTQTKSLHAFFAETEAKRKTSSSGGIFPQDGLMTMLYSQIASDELTIETKIGWLKILRNIFIAPKYADINYYLRQSKDFWEKLSQLFSSLENSISDCEKKSFIQISKCFEIIITILSADFYGTLLSFSQEISFLPSQKQAEDVSEQKKLSHTHHLDFLPHIADVFKKIVSISIRSINENNKSYKFVEEIFPSPQNTVPLSLDYYISETPRPLAGHQMFFDIPKLIIWEPKAPIQELSLMNENFEILDANFEFFHSISSYFHLAMRIAEKNPSGGEIFSGEELYNCVKDVSSICALNGLAHNMAPSPDQSDILEFPVEDFVLAVVRTFHFEIGTLLMSSLSALDRLGTTSSPSFGDSTCLKKHKTVEITDSELSGIFQFIQIHSSNKSPKVCTVFLNCLLTLLQKKHTFKTSEKIDEFILELFQKLFIDFKFSTILQTLSKSSNQVSTLEPRFNLFNVMFAILSLIPEIPSDFVSDHLTIIFNDPEIVKNINFADFAQSEQQFDLFARFLEILFTFYVANHAALKNLIDIHTLEQFFGFIGNPLISTGVGSSAQKIYLPNGERTQWHKTWCATLQLVNAIFLEIYSISGYKNQNMEIESTNDSSNNNSILENFALLINGFLQRNNQRLRFGLFVLSNFYKESIREQEKSNIASLVPQKHVFTFGAMRELELTTKLIQSCCGLLQFIDSRTMAKGVTSQLHQILREFLNIELSVLPRFISKEIEKIRSLFSPMNQEEEQILILSSKLEASQGLEPFSRSPSPSQSPMISSGTPEMLFGDLLWQDKIYTMIFNCICSIFVSIRCFTTRYYNANRSNLKIISSVLKISAAEDQLSHVMHTEQQFKPTKQEIQMKQAGFFDVVQFLQDCLDTIEKFQSSSRKQQQQQAANPEQQQQPQRMSLHLIPSVLAAMNEAIFVAVTHLLYFKEQSENILSNSWHSLTREQQMSWKQQANDIENGWLTMSSKIYYLQSKLKSQKKLSSQSLSPEFIQTELNQKWFEAIRDSESFLSRLQTFMQIGKKKKEGG